MPQFEQLRAVAIQLARQLGGGHALGNTAHQEDQFPGSPPEAMQGGAGEGVEDPATVAAAVIPHGRAVAAVDPHPVGLVAARAGQPLGVQPRDQLGVTGVLVHQIDNREVHRHLAPSNRGRTS